MNTKILILLLTVIAPKRLNSAGNTLANITHFDDYTLILASVAKPIEKLRILEVIWAEIRADFLEDIDKITALHQSAKTTSTATMSDSEQQCLAELQQKLRSRLIDLNGQLLSEAMKGKQFPHAAAVADFRHRLTQKYDMALVHDIYRCAIERSYDAQSVETFSVKLQSLPANDLKEFEVMVEAQLHLFWTAKARGGAKDLFLYNMAYYFKKMRAHANYSKLSADLHARVQIAIDAMPQSMRYLFNSPYFCLLNKRYQEYLYVTTGVFNMDDNRRYTLIWHYPEVEPKVKYEGHWQELASTNDMPNLEVSLYNIGRKMYTYVEYNDPKYNFFTLAWRPGTRHEHSPWQVSFHGDYVVFKQKDLLLCATNDFLNEHRRHARAVKSNTDDPNCLWMAGEYPI